jgi:SPP1 gp7 family putative phage head morphogenesis protein
MSDILQIGEAGSSDATADWLKKIDGGRYQRGDIAASDEALQLWKSQQPDHKALDLARWQSKATKALKAGKRASVAFESAAIPLEEAAAIKTALEAATTVDAVRDAFKKKDDLTPEEMQLMIDIGRVFAKYADDIEQAVANGDQGDLDALSKDLGATVERAIIARYVQQVGLVSRDTGIVFDPAKVQNDASAWANQYTPELIGGLNETTRDLVQRIILEGRSTPLTLSQIAERLAPAFGRQRADVIATTELTRAAAQATVASQEYLRQAGVNMVMIWQTNNDERTCPICVPRNGARQGEGWDEPPPAHPRCRCYVTLTRAA